MNLGDKLFLVPKTGATVADPRTGEVLPKEGAFRILTEFYVRRILDGDASVGAAPPTPPKTQGGK